MVPSLGGVLLFSHLNGYEHPLCTFSYFPTSSPSYIHLCFHSCSHKRGVLEENLTSHHVLINLKEISLPRYKSESSKSQRWRNCRYPIFTVFKKKKYKNSSDLWGKSRVKSLGTIIFVLLLFRGKTKKHIQKPLRQTTTQGFFWLGIVVLHVEDRLLRYICAVVIL